MFNEIYISFKLVPKCLKINIKQYLIKVSTPLTFQQTF